MVRGKFKLVEVTQFDYSPTAKRYKFQAVCDDGTPENQRFAKYTPNGEIVQTIDNPSAQEQFKLGEFYYFDAAPVPLAAAAS